MNSSIVSPRPRRFGLRTETGLLVAVLSVLGAVVAGWLTYRQMAPLPYKAGLDHGQAVLDALAAPASVAVAETRCPLVAYFAARTGRGARAGRAARHERNRHGGRAGQAL